MMCRWILIFNVLLPANVPMELVILPSFASKQGVLLGAQWGGFVLVGFLLFCEVLY